LIVKLGTRRINYNERVLDAFLNFAESRWRDLQDKHIQQGLDRSGDPSLVLKSVITKKEVTKFEGR